MSLVDLQLPTELQARPSEDNIVIHGIDEPVPEGLPEPPLWKIYVMPVGIKKKSRGIILIDDAVDAQLWMHQLCKVCAVGPQVMKGPAYAEYDISEEEKPKVGELWLIDPKQPRRFAIDETHNIIIVNDDQLLGRVDPKHAHRLKFFGFNLT